ncbi:hypothetical protein G7Z17_g255 [Cylindrodendrum hubeiense]|uniref:Uncharacterized protein n=1 Tax=Cylindrodendrum hubeiense TaxID=595255 RepID=A0A9P5LGC5_9HYPO|nr:hypothetical protein G7Z17_g255 [Cylindrodendrum hubeiense]
MTAQDALGFAATSQALAALAIGFTAPSSLSRPAVATFVLALTWLFHQAIQDALESRLHMALLSTGMWIQCVKSFDDLCLTGLSFSQETAGQAVHRRSTTQTPAKGPAGVKKASCVQLQESQSSEITRRLFFGLGSLWNMRGIGTNAEIKQVPPWSKQDPSFVPSRSQELKRHLKNVALSYLVLDVFANQPPPDLENMMSPRNERLFSRLADIGSEEAIFRFFATFGFWLNTFCVIQLINSTIALLCLQH